MVDPRPFLFEVPCPHCGHQDRQLIGELVGKDEIACRACGEAIDLTDEQWKAGLLETIKDLGEIHVLPKSR